MDNCFLKSLFFVQYFPFSPTFGHFPYVMGYTWWNDNIGIKETELATGNVSS